MKNNLNKTMKNMKRMIQNMACSSVILIGSTAFGGDEPGDSSSSISWKNSFQVEMKNLLGHNDVVYLSPARYEYEAMPVGNGRLCAMVRNETGLNLQLNHADNVWFQSSSGRVNLKGDNDLLEGVEKFEQIQSLYDGTIRTDCRSKAGEWKSVVTAIEGSDVVAIHFEGKVRGKLSLELEQWRQTVKPASSGIGFVEELPVSKAEQFSRRQALSVAADCEVSAGEMFPRNSRMIIPVELKPVAKPDGSVSFTVYIANVFTPMDEDAEAKATEALSNAQKAGWEKLSTETAAAWAKFWEKSFVHVSSPDGTADYMENLWLLHLYWMNCGGRGEFPIKFNGGPFLPHRDDRTWATGYWYQNTRQPYWPLPAANQLELCKPFEHLYLSVLPVQMETTKRLFHVEGAAYEETMFIDGIGDREKNAYTCLVLATGLELSLQLYRHYLFTRDEEYLKSTVWPVMRETARFFVNWLKREEDGLYHMYPTNARETYWRVKDAISDLAAIRRVFPIVIELSQRLDTNKDLAARCEDILKSLAPFPTDPDSGLWLPCLFLQEHPDTGNPTIENVYPPERTSHSLAEAKNAETVEGEPIFPWELVGIGSDPELLQIARDTFAGRRRKNPSCGWDPQALWAARLGLVEEAERLLVVHTKQGQPWPQGFITEGSDYVANLLESVPYLEPVVPFAFSEMLMQSWNGPIRVWPVVPATWNGSFRLRAQTGFMVASERKDDDVAYVAIESLFGDECRLVSPWNEEWVVTQGDKEIGRGKAEEVVFPTVKGQTYVIQRAAAKVASMKFERLSPAVNRDVKWMQDPTLLDEEKYPSHYVKPMLGITRDGWTEVRSRIQKNRDIANEGIQAIVGDRKPLAVASATLSMADGKTVQTPWVTDGVYGAEFNPEQFDLVRSGRGNALINQPPLGYVLELAKPTLVSAVVWSYDRNGVKCLAAQFSRHLKVVLVETSEDGTTWTSAGKADGTRAFSGSQFGNPDWTRALGVYGQAVPLDKPIETKHIRVSFLDKDGKLVGMPVDEIEVY